MSTRRWFNKMIDWVFQITEDKTPGKTTQQGAKCAGPVSPKYGRFKLPYDIALWFSTADDLYGSKLEWAFTHKDNLLFRLCVQCGSVPCLAGREYPQTATKRLRDCSHNEYLLKPRVWAMDKTGHAFIVTYEQCVICNTLVARRDSHHCPSCGNPMGCMIVGKGYNGKGVQELILLK
jgi:hypothetical protein